MSDAFIFGSDSDERIVSVEASGNTLFVFREHANGKVSCYTTGGALWLVSKQPTGEAWTELAGDLPYKYLRRCQSKEEFWEQRRQAGRNAWCVYDDKEAALIATGKTYFKGMKVEDVSVLSFDIEATTLEHGPDAKVLLISNTFRRAGMVERRLFAYNDYEDEAGMFHAWAEWVRERDPSIVTGHNVHMYDFPYIAYCAAKCGASLPLGRNSAPLAIDDYDSRFRVDGAKSYEYRQARIFGREIVDTLFLAYKYDVGRKYESYGLKKIIAQEGLEVAGREHYNAADIAKNYQNPQEWERIKRYAIHDADDALALYDLMVPALFYLNQSVPKSFQGLVGSASGSWLNSFLVRSYLQEGHSLPDTTEAADYEGAISIGNPGIYQNVFKVDVASLYPSIILQWNVYDAAKDPKGHFLRMVQHFTAERLANKRRAKETGERYYSDLEQAQKIVINSAYGMLGAPGLLFNSPKNAGFITTAGREILTAAMNWAETLGYKIVNADTDSISITKGFEWTQPRCDAVLKALNDLMPARIRWEHDGVYPRVVVVKAKNYILDDGKKLKVKGSALKATTKEPALQRFLRGALHLLLDQRPDLLLDHYQKYVREIFSLTNINDWCSKKTITEAVLYNTRTNEAKVRAAIEGTDYRAGDKIYTYFDTAGNVRLAEQWKGDHDCTVLLEKLYSTLETFETLIDVKQFPKYHLKRSQGALKQLVAAV
jgi:DNA polymerase, archaea type